MLTMPWTGQSKRMINLYITRNDIHEWIIGYEVGRDGYRHIHVRFNGRGDFGDVQRAFPGAHIEEGTTMETEYEKKDGHFVSYEDSPDVLRCRFGKLRDHQRRVVKLLEKQSDRGILCWYDETGSIGKSFTCRHLVERRRAYYVPPTVDNVKQIIQWVCSGYQRQRYLIIDIPRSAEWNKSLYTGLEAIKDGLIYDTRYSAKLRDIWGVKILVLTNSLPNLDALSQDRWMIINRDGKDVTEWARIESKKRAKKKADEGGKKKTKKSEE
ncbi:replication associated protein [Sheep faeces associated smacovirus 3]|uniref:Replication associated protein n=1 Tax=Sheep faeces associated smacovirus 3 TaxID=1843758 RepID=A0A168MFI8_9VIRU|nr:replication associated protein [Sheep faeces associated smacovirus 3]ANC51526.1 replication associated protein [Sheep faeces associated smacovirus 3]